MQKLAYGASLRASILNVFKSLIVLASVGLLIGQALASTATTTALSFSPGSPVGKGVSVALTATVTGASPTGNVTFMNGSTSLGSAQVRSGVATFNTSFSTKGSFSLTAVYAGDSNNAGSTSSAQPIVVGNATTTTLTPPTGQIGTGQSVNFSATIGGGTSPTGTVSLYDGATKIGTGTLASGATTIATSFTTAGTHSISAIYSGDSANGGSSATAQNVTVLTTSTSTVSLSANPIPAGQTITLTDTVTGNSPSGSVTFYQSGTSLGTATISSGVATLSHRFSTKGSYSITASYAGDSNNTAGTSAGVTLNVLNATSSSLTASPTAAATGQSVTLTDTVTGATSPTGSVTFKDGANTLGSANINTSGVATLGTSFAAAGSHSLTATYAGDSNNATTTTTAVAYTVTGPSTTTLSSSNGSNPAGTGKSVTLTATVTGTGVTPTGSVTFKDGSTTLGSGTLSNGVATLATTFSATGSHSLTAVYGGDTYNTTSTSSADNVAVITGSTVTLAANPSSSVPGQSVTFTANVAGNSPTGSVSFIDGSTTLGSASVSAGKATYTTSFSTLGNHSITATYSGDANNTPGTSSALSFAVLTPTTNVMSATPNPVLLNANVSLGDNVTGNNPNGLVNYYDGSTLITSGGNTGLIGGIKFSTVGVHNLTAVFTGDANNAASTSPVYPLVVVTSTSTSLSGSTSSIWGASTTYTATVTGTSGTPAPTGSVSLYASGAANPLATAALYNGTAKITTDFTPIYTGNYSLTAVYSGDNYNNTSTSGPVSVTISTSTSPNIDFTPLTTVAAINDTVPLAITIHNAKSQGGVTIKDGGSTIAVLQYNSNTPNAYPYNFVPTTAGAHNLTVAYSGIGGDTTSLSASANINVTSAVGADSLTVSTGTSSVSAGQSVTFTAAVAGNSPTGKVFFYDGATQLGSATIANGQAAYTTSFTAGGMHAITANYNGDLQNGTLSSNAVNVSVTAADSTTFSLSANPAAVGQSIIATATLTPVGGGAPPSGQFTFSDNGTTLGSVNVTGGKATYNLNYASTGSHTIAAAYAGDPYNAASSQSVTLVVNTSTESNLTTNINPAVQNQPVTITAAVNGNNPTGSVSFYDGATLLGSANLANGQASYTASFATAGSHSLSVAYGGDANNASSTSGTFALTILVPANSVAADVNPAQVGQAVNLTATITGANPTGNVTFMAGSTTLGSAPLTNGQAHLRTSFTSAINYSIVAKYSGDANNPASTSTVALTETVNPAQAIPTVSLTTPSANQVYVTQPATISIAAAASSPGSIASVAFYNGSTQLGIATSAPYTYTWSNVAAGTYTLTAVATDNVGFTGTSTPITVRVNSPPTVVMSSPVNGTVFTAPGPAMDITAATGDTDGTVVSVDMFMSANGGPTQAFNSPTSPPWTVHWNSVAAGSYQFWAVAHDNDGATTTSAPVTIQSVPSSTCVASTPASGSYTADTTGSVWGNSSTGFTVNSDIGAAIAQMGVAPGTSANVTVSALGSLASFSGMTANGITSNNAGAGCGMMLTFAPTISVVRMPSPMIAGAPFSITATASPSTAAIEYSCSAPSGTNGYRGSGPATSGQAITGTALAAWVGIPSTCTWTATAPGGTATYTEPPVVTNLSSSYPFTFNFTANGVAGNSIVYALTTSQASQISGQPEATVTFNGSVTDAGGTVTSLTIGNGNGSPIAASFPMTVSLPAGTWTYTLTATDNNGNSSSTSITLTVVATNGSPVVSINVNPASAIVAPGATAPVTVSASATSPISQVSSLTLMQSTDGGSTYTPVQNGTTSGGTTATMSQNTTLNLGVGSYKFQVVAKDAQSNPGTSAPASVNVLSASTGLAGQISGIRDDGSGNLYIFGYACLGSNPQLSVNYQVFAGPPGGSGSQWLASGQANTIDNAGDPVTEKTQQAAEVISCGGIGQGHDFVYEFTAAQLQSYGSSPIYVQVSDGEGKTLTLNCPKNNCTLPGNIRVGIDEPMDPTTTIDIGKLFVSAIVSNGDGTGTVTFDVNGTTYTASPDSSKGPGRYSAWVTANSAGSPYTITAYLQQEQIQLASSPVHVTITPSGSALITLSPPDAQNLVAPATITLTANTYVANPALDSVEFLDNGTPISNPSNVVLNATAQTWTFVWSAVQAGPHRISAVLQNGSGAPLANSDVMTVNVAPSVGTSLTASLGMTPVTTTLPGYAGNAMAGSLPGAVSVGKNGAATYSIPIAVPPGTNGLAPQISLNYSSLGGNGIAGYGWSLSAGSSIHRCIHTVAQDGYAGPIHLGDFSSSDTTPDALCLDGQRLLLTSGSYGTVGSTYHTEIDSGARITIIGGVNNQIAFKVETKGGRIKTYGTTADSAVRVVGKVDQNKQLLTIATPLYWDIASESDLAGNVIDYYYWQDVDAQGATASVATGEHLLTTIAYGNSGTQYNRIEFNYECRNGVAGPGSLGTPIVGTPSNTGPTSNCTGATTLTGDADVKYQVGARIDVRHRLHSVMTYTNGQGGADGVGVQTTTLTYATSPTSQRSLLQQIQVCVTNTPQCLPATTFTWGQIAANSTHAFVDSGIMPSGPPQDWGKQPSLFPANNTLSRSGFLANYPDGWLGNARYPSPIGVVYTYNTLMSTVGSGMSFPSVAPNPAYDYQRILSSMITGDFYGDGKQRILTADSLGGTGEGGETGWHIYTANATGSDFARVDLPYSQNGNLPTQLLISVPNTNAANSFYSTPPGPVFNGQILVGDFDGDGASDIAFLDLSSPGNSALNIAPYVGSKNWVVCLSRMATQGNFDCQSFPYGQSGSWGGNITVFSTAPDGRSVVALPGYSSDGITREQIYAYVPPSQTGTGKWAWSPVATYIDPTGALDSTFSSDSTWGSFSSSMIGDFWGTGQSSFISQSNQSSDFTINSVLFVAVADQNSMSQPVGAMWEPIPQVPYSNQFVWTQNRGWFNGGGSQQNNVQRVTQRYVVSESHGAEGGGTPVGDLNGDGYTDYLFTFEGHAEICYSNGIDGFDCRLMEDDTPNSWIGPGPYTIDSSGNPRAPAYVPQLSIAPDANGLEGVFSVLSIGHAYDHNSTDVIYRAGDGGSYNSGKGGLGGNQFLVCSLKDGMKSCTPWTGPKLRPYATWVNPGYAPFIPNAPVPYLGDGNYQQIIGTSVNWPVAGTISGDFTGNGQTEILWYCNDSTQPEGKGWRLYRPQIQTTGPIDRMMSVKNGTGNTTTINYKPLSDSTVYAQKPSDGYTVTYPMHTMTDGGRMVVSSVSMDAGSGNSATTSYFYEGLAIDTTGRGEQGFERMTVTDPQRVIHSTQYAQGFPFTGMELGTTTVSAGAQLINQDCSKYALPASASVSVPSYSGLLEFSCSNLSTVPNAASTGKAGGETAAVCPFTSIAQQLVHQDLNGSLLPLRTRSVAITNYCDSQIDVVTTAGRSGQSVSTQSDVFTSSTTNTWNYSQSPYVAQLLSSVITKSSTSEAPITRIKQNDYFGQTVAGFCSPLASGLAGPIGMLADEIVTGVIGPATSLTPAACSTSITLQTSYGRDGYGNVNQMNQYWTDSVKGAQFRVNLKAWFDGNGRYLASSQNALGASLGKGQLLSYYQFDPGTGIKTVMTNMNGLTTTWVPDGFGRIAKEIRTDGTETDYATVQCMGGGGACPSNIDGQQAYTATITSHFYNSVSGAKTQIAVPEVALIDTAGHTLRNITWGYDGSEIDSDNTYDADGRLDHTYQPFFNGSQAYVHHQQVYDELNRVVQMIQFDEVGNAQTTTTSYQGMATQVTNPKQFYKVEYHDALGQVVQMQDTIQNLTTYARDAWGNLASVTNTDSNNNSIVTQIQYDALGHKTDLIDPDLGHVRYCVDARGLTWQQVSPIAASGITGVSNGNYCTQAWSKAQNMTFDVLDRMTARAEPSLNSYWVYDSTTGAANCVANKTCGKLVEACTGGSGCGDTAHKDYDRVQTYDGMSRPTTTTTSLTTISGLAGSFVSANNYDTWGRLCSVYRQAGSNAPGVTYANAFSATGYLSQIVRVNTTAANDICANAGLYTQKVLWQADEQDASDRVTASSLGNGLTVSRSYDPFTGHLADSSVVNGSGNSSSNIVSEGYQYDVLGNVTNRTEEWSNSAAFSEAFGYDGLNRLTSSQVFSNTSATQMLYNFDNLGNITSKSGVGSGASGPGQYSYTYSATACAGITGASTSGPHAVTSIGGITSGNNGAFCYDADGNLLQDPWRSTSWTSFDMPLKIIGSNGISQFTYGPEHQRTRQIRLDMTLLYSDGMEIDVPTSGSNTIKTYWPAGLGLETNTGGASVFTWTHSDNLDSVVAITDVNGNLVQQMAYDAWGARRDLIGDPGVISAASGYLNGQALIDNKGFTHQEELDQLGLVHLNGRVYDPFTGRFLSADPVVSDPLHSQSFNRYTYVWNNPTNLTDPSGFEPNECREESNCHVNVVVTAHRIERLTVPQYMALVPQGPSLFRKNVDFAKGAYVGIANDTSGLLTNLRPMYVGPSIQDLLGENPFEIDASGGPELTFGVEMGPALLALIPGFQEEEAGAVGSAKLEELIAKCMKCFVRGTLVKTRKGFKPIDKIRVGDLVAARDESTGETAWKPVLQVFHNHKQVILRLIYSNRDGKLEELGVTEEHPFMLESKHWIAATQLKPGDKILSFSGDVLTISDVRAYAKKHDTYNLEVKDFHTFFVGSMEAWVHNADPCKQLASSLSLIKRGTKEWDAAVKKLQSLFKKGDKLNLRTETASDAKALLEEGRGKMDLRKEYTHDQEKYKKGYEHHNDQNAREIGAGNDLQHIKWYDDLVKGHIFYDLPN